MKLAGKRIAILAEEDFEDSEFAEPMKAAYPAIPEPCLNLTRL